MKEEDLRLYKISVDEGHSFTEQWMTQDETHSTRMAHPDWLIIETYVMPIQDAISIMEHWVDYEKKNKDKIEKADELIDIQETILSYIKTQNKAMQEILEKIEDKEREMNDCDDQNISEQDSEAYLSGLNHAKMIVQEIMDYIKGGGRYA